MHILLGLFGLLLSVICLCGAAKFCCRPRYVLLRDLTPSHPHPEGTAGQCGPV